VAARYDLLIRNATVIDGTRAPRFEADIGISSGKIVSIGSLINSKADVEIDASGRIVGAAKIAHDVTANRQAQAAFREEVHALEILHRVGQTVAGQNDLDQVVQTVTDAATELCGASFGAFFYNVVNDNKESYWLYVLSGVPREAFAQFPMPRSTAVFEPTCKGDAVVRSGNIKPLAATSKSRSALLPDVPTTTQVGLPTVLSDNWYGLAAPAGVSKPVLDRIHAAAVAVLNTKEAAEPMMAQGAVIRPMTPAEFSDFVRLEREKWGPVVKSSGAKME